MPHTRTLIEGEIRGTWRIMRKNPYQTRFRREFYRIIGGGELKNRQTPPSFQRLGDRICGKTAVPATLVVNIVKVEG